MAFVKSIYIYICDILTNADGRKAALPRYFGHQTLKVPELCREYALQMGHCHLLLCYCRFLWPLALEARDLRITLASISLAIELSSSSVLVGFSDGRQVVAEVEHLN